MVDRQTKQQLENQLGEIHLRKAKYESQIDDSWEGRSEQMQRLEQQNLRTDQYYKQVYLKKGYQNTDLFLELGAERAQRSLFLKNRYDLNIMALDISFFSLKFSHKIRELMGFEKDIDRVCTDLYNLPFCNHSVSHIFCFETLHHFPDVKPILREIGRVLGRGEFYFCEEPFKMELKTKIFRLGKEPFKRWNGKGDVLSKVLKYVKYWFLQWPIIEDRYNVIENYDIRIEDYLEGFSVFDDYRVRLTPTLPFVKDVFLEKSSREGGAPFLLKYLIARGAGGNIEGFCESTRAPAGDGVLACPNCLVVRCDEPCQAGSLPCREACRQAAVQTSGRRTQVDLSRCTLCLDCLYACPEERIDRYPLALEANGFLCNHCGQNFPVKDGVLFLLSDQSYQNLYKNSDLLSGM